MSSLRSHEGEYLSDHSCSPGIPEELRWNMDMPPGMGAKDTKFECATFTCADCETVVFVNPKRNRPRGYCPKCDHLLCDACEGRRFLSGGQCFNRKMLIDRLRDAQARLGPDAVIDVTAELAKPIFEPVLLNLPRQSESQGSPPMLLTP